jgi:hypothetical protein
MSIDKKDSEKFWFDDAIGPIQPIDPVFCLPPCYPAFTYDPGRGHQVVKPTLTAGKDSRPIESDAKCAGDRIRDTSAQNSSPNGTDLTASSNSNGEVQDLPSEGNRHDKLRAIAEGVIQDAFDDEYSGSGSKALVMSLVKQWVRYDGHATFLTDEMQFYVDLNDGQGESAEVSVTLVVVEKFFRRWMRDWDLDHDQLLRMIGPLNLEQSALVKNRSGRQLRVWVDPKHRSKGIERVEHDVSEQPQRRNYRKLALDALAEVFGEELPAPIDGDFAIGLVRQWVTCDGHGMFLKPDAQVFITLKPQPDGGCIVEITERPSTIGKSLGARGLTVDDVISIIYRLNSGHTPEFTDSEGRHWRLVTDAKMGQVNLEPIDALSE